MTNRIPKISLKWLLISFLFWTQVNAGYECCEDYQEAPFYNSYDVCKPSIQFWVNTEYLFWKIKNSPNPVPLLVTAPFANNRVPLIGVLGTSVVIGHENVRTDWRSGGRFTLGLGFEGTYCFGTEINYFFLPDGSKSQRAASSGLPGSIFLSVPYFDTTTRRESSSPVAEPGSFSGLVNFKLTNRLQGAELNGFATLYSNYAFKINALAGFRYLNFNERLRLHVNSPAINIPQEIFLVSDKFHTNNNFYGGQIGLAGEYFCNRFFINAKGKVALGAMQQEVNIKGEFITNVFNGFGAPQTFLGGYFALPSNRGRHRKTCFAVVPEVNVNLGYQIMDCLRIQAGYTFLYANKMLWAGKQINRNINPTQSSLYEFTATPTPTGKISPKASLKSESFWVQGLNVSLEFEF
ncbi:MAG: hypothetical protein CK425_07715 [Parachlamydia sp.]|nr:MAG: hypothetical protein CK425_07715 [Parachlamydia sp.]